MNEGLQRARERAQAMREQGIKPVRKNPIEKLADNPTSLRAAINAKCYQCEGEDADPGVRRRIGTCEITSCALHAVRPYQKRDEDTGDELAA